MISAKDRACLQTGNGSSRPDAVIILTIVTIGSLAEVEMGLGAKSTPKPADQPVALVQEDALTRGIEVSTRRGGSSCPTLPALLPQNDGGGAAR